MHFADFAAGSIGGALGVFVGYPLDTVKVRLQTQRHYKGLWHCVHSIYKTERLSGFFKGVSMPVSTVSVSSSVAFGTYRNCLQCIQQCRYGSGDARPAHLDFFLSGLAAGSAQVVVMSPADVVKVRLQTQTQPEHAVQGSTANMKVKYQGPLHCMATIVREEGIFGLYRGAHAMMLKDGPSFATYFLTYNIFCEWLTPAGQKQPEWSGVLLAGGCAGTCAWGLATPMDVIKARLQADGLGKRRYSGVVNCITESARQEGARVFFKGLGLNCARAFPVNMVVFATYEMVLKLIP
ncbi:solute carrier family 25 member 47-like isoform X1 [Acipenser oxyrinchus oxyrinchus]|uniref:Solute carrier family 25 member 47-like isoform X1 n=1 Tax=Acipenser oxyrinchus oxyrinchus TaxID=40147 RepID=A0AAD8FXA2_ACIOX|nr:solute carrier family 25 member 47-like isoform X1 [Acipenser oxyrinchus oxyrinchus]